MNVAKKVLRSAALLVAIKFIHRSLGLISILILARLLTPADFGLVALVSITVYLFDVLSSAGSDQYIIRKDSVTRADLDTAWTIDLCVKTVLWAALISFSPHLAAFFGQADLEQALLVGGCVLPINALASARLNILKQDLDYHSIFWLATAQRFTAFLLVIWLALTLRNYWAIVLGDVIASTFFTIGSYVIAPHRPRPTLIHARVQWRFSFWMLLKGIVGYTRAQIDTLFISKLFPASVLGQYHLARDIAMIPANNLIVPATEPLLALFRVSRTDPDRLTMELRSAVLLTGIIVVPIVSFFIVFPDVVVGTVLGESWLNAAGLLQSLSLLLLYFSFFAIYEKVLIAANKVRVLFVLELAGLATIVLGLLLAMNRTPEEIGLLRGVLGTLNLLVLVFVTSKILHVSNAVPVLSILIVVVISGISTLSANMVVAAFASESSPVLILCIASCSFVSVYTIGLCAVLFLVQGKQLNEWNSLRKTVMSRIRSLRSE